MLVNTKYSLGDMIWFLYQGELQCCTVIGVESMTTKEGDDTISKTVYFSSVKTTGGNINVVVSERNAFESKDELINTISERFYKSLEQGSA